MPQAPEVARARAAVSARAYRAQARDDRQNDRRYDARVNEAEARRVVRDAQAAYPRER